MPESPRIGQDGSEIASALGDRAPRRAFGRGGRPTVSGVGFAAPLDQGKSWAALVDCKCLSDSAVMITNDPLRNQLVRTIEDALALWSIDGQVPIDLHVVLLTPELFRDHPTSRLYGHKFHEYRSDTGKIAADLERCCLERREAFDLAPRLAALRLHWTTYEEVIEAKPACLHGIAQAGYRIVHVEL